MNSRIRWLATPCCALVCWGAFPGSSAAQEFAGGSVHGTGNVVIKRLPDTMRVQVAIIGKGANLKEAVAALKTRVDAARKQVESLGADKESITVDTARIFEQQNDQRRQMEMMMAQRMRGGGKKNAKNKTSPPVMLSSQLTASWKLDAKDAEDLLLKSHPLQEKLKSADLGGSKEAEKLSPEQEELLEEAESQGFSPYDDGSQQKPGEPMFYFVTQITEEERDQALADAYKKATIAATRLAKSAGAKLGRLKSVQDTNYGGGGMDEDYYDGSYNYNSRAYRAMQFVRNQQGRSDEKLEAIGAEPGQVKYAVNVTASFDLEPGP